MNGSFSRSTVMPSQQGSKTQKFDIKQVKKGQLTTINTDLFLGWIFDHYSDLISYEIYHDNQFKTKELSSTLKLSFLTPKFLTND